MHRPNRLALLFVIVAGCAEDAPFSESDPVSTPAANHAEEPSRDDADDDTSCSGLVLSFNDPNPANAPGRCTGGFALGEFSAEDAQVIRDAGYDWNLFARRPLVHLGAASACAIVPGDQTAPASHLDGVIKVNPANLAKENRAFLRYVIKHEIGRAMGMHPNRLPSGVMSTCTKDGVFNSAEFKECRRLGLCYSYY